MSRRRFLSSRAARDRRDPARTPRAATEGHQRSDLRVSGEPGERRPPARVARPPRDNAWPASMARCHGQEPSSRPLLVHSALGLTFVVNGEGGVNAGLDDVVDETHTTREESLGFPRVLLCASVSFRGGHADTVPYGWRRSFGGNHRVGSVQSHMGVWPSHASAAFYAHLCQRIRKRSGP